MQIAIVGAGAAGLASAIFTARAAQSKKIDIQVTLFDGREKIGAKILMSGGTRCNVTHRVVVAGDYEGGAKHFVKHVLEGFTAKQTRDFFSEIGVELMLEDTGKYFPSTGSAKTVLEALVREVDRLGIQWMKDVKIVDVIPENGKFRLVAQKGEFKADRVILATGGLSHPDTGSDGTGLEIAKRLGHTITPTFAALTPFLTKDKDWPTLSGIALDVKLAFFSNGRKTKECVGAMLFTHFGFSGPVVLDISRHWAVSHGKDAQIFVSFLPKSDEAEFKSHLKDAMRHSATRFIEHYLIDEFSFAERFVEVFLRKIGVPESTVLRQLSARNQKALTEGLFRYPLEVSDVYGFRKAEVTAGGVDLKEVSFSTMESKKVPGLYFTGEILDADGRIGGFNFQWSWSTAAIAGKAIVRS